MFPSPVLNPTNTLVEAIINASPNAERLFRDKFEAGILFLLKRYRLSNFQTSVDAIIADSLDEIRDGKVTSDSEIPSLVRRHVRQLLALHSDNASRGERDPKPDALPETTRALAAARVPLERCTHLERNVLFLFYVQGVDEPTICQSLDVSLQLVRSIRAAARQAVGLAFAEPKLPLRLSRKPAGWQSRIASQAAAAS
jgi:hypothetical protein